jgi:hypothetical protein
MKKFQGCVLLIFLLALCPVFLPSCAMRINGSLDANGSAVLFVDVSLGTRMAALIRSLSAVAGQADAPVLDGNAVAQSMARAPGIASVTLRNTSPSAIEGQVRILQINDFLSVAGRGFITFQQIAGAGGSCVINIDRTTSPEILELFSSEISDYLNALMAPIASGEELNKLEYLELVANFYNRAISDEIASSRIHASINFPGTVTSVRGGTFSGRRAVFDIPLIDLLVLETPLSYEVRWSN